MTNGEVEGKELTVLEDDDLVAIAEVAEKRIGAVKKIITMALKVTSEKDWCNQNGKPYLQGDGAEAVANLFGLSWSFIEKPYKVPEDDGNFRYECVLQMRFKSRSTEVMGARSTKDPFFSTRYRYNKETKEREQYTLIPSEIDSSDVMKASITNAIANGVTRILGIRNATWDMLKEAGLNIDKIQKIEYQQPEKEESKNLREEIRTMLLDMAGGDSNKARACLQEVTFFKGKSKSNVQDLTDAQIPVIYGKVKKLHDEWKTKPIPKEETKKEPFGKIDDFSIAIQSAATLEELDKLVADIVKAGIKGENYTNLIRERDKRATVLKEMK